MNIIKLISYNGIKESYPDSLKRKVKVSNRLTLILFILTIIYTTATLYKGLPIYKVTISGIPFCFLIAVLNNLHLHKIARVFASILPMVVVTVYHAAAMQAGQAPITASYIFGTSFLIIPFTLFDLDEKIELFSTVFACSLILLAVRTLNDYVDIPFDSSFARSETYEYMIIVLTTLIISSILYVLLKSNKNSEINNRKLVEEVKERNQSLLNSQKELEEYVKKAKENQEKDQERSWETNTLSEFNELIANEFELQKISDKTVSRLVKSLKAAQGAIYLFDPSTKTLSGISCFAHDRKRFFEKEILIGEGIVGQAFLEEESIYMTDIPEDYFDISSGLGEASPTAIIATPLVANEGPIGIIEIASFHEIKEYQKQFIEKLSESLASTFYTIQNSAKTELLLQEVQELNQKYQQQEKELQERIEQLEAEKREIIYRKKV